MEEEQKFFNFLPIIPPVSSHFSDHVHDDHGDRRHHDVLFYRESSVHIQL